MCPRLFPYWKKVLSKAKVLLVLLLASLTSLAGHWRISPDSSSVSCRRCALTRIPAWVLSSKKIQHLDLSSNRIDSLPASISGMVALQYINVRNNRLEYVSPSLAGLRALQEIRFGKNRLAWIPSEIGRMPSLQKLDLWHNQLSSVDTSWAGNKNLSWLDLRLNIIDTPQQEKLKKLFRGRHIYFSKNCNCGG
jgi:Leucine-rich repeat (LRR) protein